MVLMMRYDPIRYDDSSIKLDGLTKRIHALLYADDSSIYGLKDSLENI